MNEQIVVREKYSKYWPAISGVSSVLAVIFFLFYHYSVDPLTEGYLRLAAFCFFTLALLSLFKLRDGQIEIIHEIREGSLLLCFTLRNRIIFEHTVPLQDIEEAEIGELPDRSLYNDLAKGDRCIKIRKKGNDEWSYLHDVNDRVIPLHKENAEMLFNFIQKASKQAL